LINTKKYKYPDLILNSINEKEKFDIERIEKCFIDIGMNDDEINIIFESSFKKINILLEKQPNNFNTSMIKNIIIFELYFQNLDKYVDLYKNYEKKKKIKFVLPGEFINKYRNKQPNWGPIGYVVYKRTYARRLNGKTEEFFETIRRCVEGCYSIQKEHCIRLGLPWFEIKALTSAKIMYEKMWNFKFLPPGRGLWMMGTEFVDKHGSMCLNNCGFVSTDNIDVKGSAAFEWTMDALMLGVGVGFDVRGAGKITIKEPKYTNRIFMIPDSRRGWIDAVKFIIDGFFNGSEIPIIKYDDIRPAGLPIKGFGGISSGPDPLKELVRDIEDNLLKNIGKKITSEIIVDMMNLIGKCVVAGNVRRSAEIAIGDIDDKVFINLKNDKEKRNSHRWASNNSIFAKRGMDYSPIIDNIIKNGEPGLIWIDNIRNYSRMNDGPDYKDVKVKGVNPCSEQSLESYELCCLVETFPSIHESYEEFEETLKYAYLYAKSVTLVNTHWGITNAVMLKNRRIGVSQTGIIDGFVKHGRTEMIIWCDNGYNYLRKLDNIYSDWLCVPKSIKITSVKPSGTVSLLPGVSPGIHYPHAEYYIRRIRLMENSILVGILERSGYRIEKDKYSKNTVVVSFPIKEKYYERSKKDISIWEQFENAATYQRYWADNQVSITVTFKEKEEKDIIHCLKSYEDKIKGISLLSLDKKTYEQPPYEEIDKETYEMMKLEIKDLNFDNYKTEGEGTIFCDSDKCSIHQHKFKRSEPENKKVFP